MLISQRSPNWVQLIPTIATGSRIPRDVMSASLVCAAWPCRSSCGSRVAPQPAERHLDAIADAHAVLVDIGQLALHRSAAVEVDDGEDDRSTDAVRKMVDRERGDGAVDVRQPDRSRFVDGPALHADTRGPRVRTRPRRGWRPSRSSSPGCAGTVEPQGVRGHVAGLVRAAACQPSNEAGVRRRVVTRCRDVANPGAGGEARCGRPRARASSRCRRQVSRRRPTTPGVTAADASANARRAAPIPMVVTGGR